MRFHFVVRVEIKASSVEAARHSLTEALHAHVQFGIGADDEEEPVELVAFIVEG